MLVIAERFHHRVVVELVGHGDDNRLPGGHIRDHLAEEVRVDLIGWLGERGVGDELLTREGLGQSLVLLEGSQRRAVERAHLDAVNNARALKLVNGGQQEILCDHPAADDGDSDGFTHVPLHSKRVGKCNRGGQPRHATVSSPYTPPLSGARARAFGLRPGAIRRHVDRGDPRERGSGSSTREAPIGLQARVALRTVARTAFIAAKAQSPKERLGDYPHQPPGVPAVIADHRRISGRTIKHWIPLYAGLLSHVRGNPSSARRRREGQPEPQAQNGWRAPERKDDDALPHRPALAPRCGGNLVVRHGARFSLRGGAIRRPSPPRSTLRGRIGESLEGAPRAWQANQSAAWEC